ncbi:MAG: hypothetical protein JWR09_4168 [Mucilaginibacter sp.]|nr:hypothetical protein [Mucilaginibacter sp.]
MVRQLQQANYGNLLPQIRPGPWPRQVPGTEGEAGISRECICYRKTFFSCCKTEFVARRKVVHMLANRTVPD